MPWERHLLHHIDLEVFAGSVDITAGEHTVVARIDAASKIARGSEGELWVDASKLHVFDPESGDRL